MLRTGLTPSSNATGALKSCVAFQNPALDRQFPFLTCDHQCPIMIPTCQTLWPFDVARHLVRGRLPM